MGIVSTSSQERGEFDGFVEAMRRIMIAKIPLPLVAGAIGVSEEALTAAILDFLTSCRLTIETEAELSKGIGRR